MDGIWIRFPVCSLQWVFTGRYCLDFLRRDHGAVRDRCKRSCILAVVIGVCRRYSGCCRKRNDHWYDPELFIRSTCRCAGSAAFVAVMYLVQSLLSLLVPSHLLHWHLDYANYGSIMWFTGVNPELSATVTQWQISWPIYAGPTAGATVADWLYIRLPLADGKDNLEVLCLKYNEQWHWYSVLFGKCFKHKIFIIEENKTNERII